MGRVRPNFLIYPMGAKKRNISKVETRAGKTLKRQAVSGRARHRCDRGVAIFVEYLCTRASGTNGMTTDEIKQFAWRLERNEYFRSADAENLDIFLANFIELAHASDPSDWSSDSQVFGRWECSEVYCGICDAIPEGRGKLARSHRVLTSWSRQGEVTRAPPAPVELVLGILGYAVGRGDWRFAAGVICMYFGLLRPAEFFDLRRKNIGFSLGNNPRVDPTTHATLALERTKTTGRKNALEFAAVKDSIAVLLLRSCLAGLRPDDLVWSGTPGAFRHTFELALSAVCKTTPGLTGELPAFKLYSLRRGGASRLIEVLSFDYILLRGRWQSMRAARIYLESAKAESVAISLAFCRKSLARHRVSLESFARTLKC